MLDGFYQLLGSNKDAAAGGGSAHDLVEGGGVNANAKSTDHVI
eukprot:SAG22_NODE_871_length_6748_cov_60.669274_1_plen_42_part_10